MNNLILLAERSNFADPYNGAENWASRWGRFSGLGIQTAILGMLTVFAVLSLIWGCLEVFRYFFYTIPEKRKNEAEKSESETAPVAEAVQESVPEVIEDEDDGEVVAAIVAAITALRAEESEASDVPSGKFRVVSFRRK